MPAFPNTCPVCVWQIQTPSCRCSAELWGQRSSWIRWSCWGKSTRSLKYDDLIKYGEFPRWKTVRTIISLWSVAGQQHAGRLILSQRLPRRGEARHRRHDGTRGDVRYPVSQQRAPGDALQIRSEEVRAGQWTDDVIIVVTEAPFIICSFRSETAEDVTVTSQVVISLNTFCMIFIGGRDFNQSASKEPSNMRSSSRIRPRSTSFHR